MILRLLAAAALAGTFVCASEPPRPLAPWVARVGPSGEILWWTALVAPASEVSPSPRTLDAVPWFAVLPEVGFTGIDGDAVPMYEPSTRAVLLDFWASWCKPCLEELPHLEALHRAEREHGLRVLAVNVEEPPETARAAARALGLSMPVVVLPEALRREVDLDSLPALVLLDRERRVRGSWNGYRPGLENEVAARARELAGSGGVLATHALASVEVGPDVLQVLWSRPLDGPVDGIAAVPFADGTPRLIAVAGDALAALGADGRIVGRVRAAAGMGRLHVADVTGDGVRDLIGWRPGARRVGIVDMGARSSSSWDAPWPARDVLTAPAAGGVGVVVASHEAVGIFDLEGRVASTLGGDARALAGEGPTLAILGPGDVLRVVAVDGSDGRAIAVPAGAGAVIALPGDSGFALGSEEVETVTRVRGFGGGESIAVATVDGAVAILDPADGRLRFLAHWREPVRQIAPLASRAPGAEDLAVAAGRAVTLLRWGPPAVRPAVDAPSAPRVPSGADGQN